MGAVCTVVVWLQAGYLQPFVTGLCCEIVTTVLIRCLQSTALLSPRTSVPSATGNVQRRPALGRCPVPVPHQYFLHPQTMQVRAFPGMQCSIGYYCVPGSLSLLICDLLRRKDTVLYFKAYRFPYHHPSLSVFAALSAVGQRRSLWAASCLRALCRHRRSAKAQLPGVNHFRPLAVLAWS